MYEMWSNFWKECGTSCSIVFQHQMDEMHVGEIVYSFKKSIHFYLRKQSSIAFQPRE